MERSIIIDLVLAMLAIASCSLMNIINRFQSPTNLHKLEHRIDKAIPYIPPFIIFYLAYFPFIIWGYVFLFLDREYFVPFALSMIVIGIVTAALNLIFKTEAPRIEIIEKNIYARLLKWHYGLNRPLTSFPSLHVSQSFCIGFFLCLALPSLAVFWIVTAFLICISTLLVKEHYIADLLAGLVLGTSSIVLLTVAQNM